MKPIEEISAEITKEELGKVPEEHKTRLRAMCKWYTFAASPELNLLLALRRSFSKIVSFLLFYSVGFNH